MRYGWSADITFGGGVLSLYMYDYYNDKLSTPATTKETAQGKNVTFNLIWLDTDAKINDKLSISTRLSNLSSTKWDAIMLGDPDSTVPFVSFQYAYMKFALEKAAVMIGLLSVDRNMEPLEAHYTPMKTSWKSFWKATMGSMEGFNVEYPLYEKEAVKAKGDITVAKYAPGEGEKTIHQTGIPDTTVYEYDSIDYILSFPIAYQTWSVKPVFALRTCADGNDAATGGSDYRFTWGLTGAHTFSKAVSLSAGVGISSFNNSHTRDLPGHSPQNNETVFLRVVPVVKLAKGSLTLDMKYSNYLDKSRQQKVLYHYPVADLKYSFKVHNNLTIVAPFFRFLGEYYDDDNLRVHYQKNRLCTYIVFVAMI
jgi:hypothetical protein